MLIIRYNKNMAQTITKDAKALARAFGFRSEKEFIARAVQEKVRRLEAVLFSRTADKVKRGLDRAGLSEEDILAGFERSRR